MGINLLFTGSKDFTWVFALFRYLPGVPKSGILPFCGIFLRLNITVFHRSSSEGLLFLFPCYDDVWSTCSLGDWILQILIV